MIEPGMACVQHRGGIFDSSVMDWLIIIRRQSPQYVCPQGRCWRSSCLLKSSRQHMQDLVLMCEDSGRIWQANGHEKG